MTEYVFIGLAYVMGSIVSYFLFRKHIIGATISRLIHYDVIRSQTNDDGDLEILKYDGTRFTNEPN